MMGRGKKQVMQTKQAKQSKASKSDLSHTCRRVDETPGPTFCQKETGLSAIGDQEGDSVVVGWETPVFSFSSKGNLVQFLLLASARSSHRRRASLFIYFFSTDFFSSAAAGEVDAVFVCVPWLRRERSAGSRHQLPPIFWRRQPASRTDLPSCFKAVGYHTGSEW